MQTSFGGMVPRVPLQINGAVKVLQSFVVVRCVVRVVPRPKLEHTVARAHCFDYLCLEIHVGRDSLLLHSISGAQVAQENDVIVYLLVQLVVPLVSGLLCKLLRFEGNVRCLAWVSKRPIPPPRRRVVQVEADKSEREREINEVNSRRRACHYNGHISTSASKLSQGHSLFLADVQQPEHDAHLVGQQQLHLSSVCVVSELTRLAIFDRVRAVVSQDHVTHFKDFALFFEASQVLLQTLQLVCVHIRATAVLNMRRGADRLQHKDCTPPIIQFSDKFQECAPPILRIYDSREPKMQAEYDVIVRDLTALLSSTFSLDMFQSLHPGLQQAIKDIGGYSRGVTGLRETQQTTLHNLQDIAQNMTDRIFHGQKHIFYIRVMKVTNAADNYVDPPQHVSPHRITRDTVNYLVQDNCVYAVDIKNLCATPTPNLCLYDRDVNRRTHAHLTPTHRGLSHNPFSLWAPPPMPANMRNAFPGGIRLDVVRLHNTWTAHDYELREADDTIVLRLQFRVQSRYGASAGPAACGVPLLLAHLKNLQT